jgi:NAD(P)-dependent dehydrogenase (short-subunit alcohol dehydrogenase family)
VTCRIGFGVAELLLDAGANVTVLSSSADRVKEAVKRLDSPNVHGEVVDVRNEEEVVQVLKKLAPLDHVVFSGVDKIIRGKLEDLDLDDAKHLFGVKFWGAVVIGKGK